MSPEERNFFDASEGLLKALKAIDPKELRKDPEAIMALAGVGKTLAKIKFQKPRKKEGKLHND